MQYHIRFISISEKLPERYLFVNLPFPVKVSTMHPWKKGLLWNIPYTECLVTLQIGVTCNYREKCHSWGFGCNFFENHLRCFSLVGKKLTISRLVWTKKCLQKESFYHGFQITPAADFFPYPEATDTKKKATKHITFVILSKLFNESTFLRKRIILSFFSEIHYVIAPDHSWLSIQRYLTTQVLFMFSQDRCLMTNTTRE